MKKGLFLTLTLLLAISVADDVPPSLKTIRVITGIVPFGDGDDAVDIYEYKLEQIGKARIDLGNGICETVHMNETVDLIGNRGSVVQVKVPVLSRESVTRLCNASIAKS